MGVESGGGQKKTARQHEAEHTSIVSSFFADFQHTRGEKIDVKSGSQFGVPSLLYIYI